MKTIFLLMAEYGTADIPLQKIAEKYFALDKVKMLSWARQQKFPFPVYRGGSQKSEWLVSAADLSAYIDSLRADAKVLFDARQPVVNQRS